MQAVAPLLVVAALALSGCATMAQGAGDSQGAPAVPSTGSPTAAGVPADPPSAAASPMTGSSSTSAAPMPASPMPMTSAAAAGTSQLLAAAPVSPGPPLPPNPFALGGPAPVGSFVLGDSVSLSAGVGPVLARLGYPVMGVVGQSASDAYLRTNLSSAIAQAAPAWVIALGTNNTADAADVARLAGWVDVIDSLRSPADRQRVYWVTPHRPPSYLGSKSRWNMDAFNTELKRLSTVHRWLRVIDFDAVAKAHPEWFEQDAAMHLHPDSRGQGVLVALIAGPDAVPVEIPAPLLTAPVPTTAAGEPGPEPETFVNTPLPPTPASTPVPLEPAPQSSPADAPAEAPAPREPAPSQPAPGDPASPSATTG